MIVPVVAISNLVLTQQIYSEETNGAHAHYREPVPLRANVCNFRESVDSREFLNFFIFRPNNLYSILISKITLKLVTALYFFRNQAKFDKL